jgi:hypothetical protein
MMLAWGVEINSMSSIVFAETLPKARYIAVRGYWAAFGQRKGEWPRAVGWREPRFDLSSLIAQGKQGPFCRDYVEGIT